MKLSSLSRFPYPVLSEETQDYLSGAFNVTISVREDLGANQVDLDYSVELTEPTLRSRVAVGDLGVGLLTSCQDTYFSGLVPIGLDPGRVSFDPGSLTGRVLLQPIVWAKQQLSNIKLPNIHEEFQREEWDFNTGAVLALSEPLTLNVGREKLAQVETIFSLVESPAIKDDSFALQLDAEKIQIHVASNIYQQVNQLRGMVNGAPILLNSVYLPAIMQVLAILAGGASGYEGRRWHRIFVAKCDHLGIQPAEDDLWDAAQRILETPFKALKGADIWG